MKWMWQLLMEYDFGKEHVLLYALSVSRFIVPFKSLLSSETATNKSYPLSKDNFKLS